MLKPCAQRFHATPSRRTEILEPTDLEVGAAIVTTPNIPTVVHSLLSKVVGSAFGSAKKSRFA